MDLKDKVVVITGGSKGIGKALAEICKERGAKVLAPSHEELDVRNEEAVQNFMDQVIAEHGKVDIWVNNAGVMNAFSEKGELVDMKSAHETMDVNFFGTVFGCRHMLKKTKEGIIVNILSTAALDTSRTDYAKIYAASKWAVRGYTQAIRGANKNPNIKIIAVYPGGTKTDLFKDNKPGNYDDFMDPKDLAEKIVKNLEQEDPEQELILKRPSKEN